MGHDAYHDRSEISRSMLMEFRRSPRVYEAKYVLGSVPTEPETTAMKIGTVTHCAILQGADLESMVAVIPSELLSAAGGVRSAAAREWKAIAEADGKRVLKAHELADELSPIYAMRDAVLAHKVRIGNETVTLGDVIRHQDSVTEHPIYWTDDATLLALRALPDFLRVMGSIALIIDIKTIADMDNAGRAIADSYWMQPPHYCEAVRQSCDGGIDDVWFLFVFVEKSAPWRVRVVQMSSAMHAKASQKWRETLGNLAERMYSGDWSDAGESEINVVDREIWEVAL